MQHQIHRRVLLALLCLCLALAQGEAKAQIYGPTNTFDNWFPDNGVWQTGVPASKVGPGDTYNGAPSCVGTVLSGSNAGTYPANTTSNFVSPAINLPSVTSGQHIVLTFAQWFSWAGYDPSYQAPSYGQVQVATWNSKTSSWNNWTPLAQYGGGTHNYAGSSSPGWSLSSVDLTAFANNQIEIGFEQIGGTNTAPGWYIDDVGVYLQSAQSLPYAENFGSSTATSWDSWTSDDGGWQVGTPIAGIGPAYTYNKATHYAGTVLSGSHAGTYPANTNSNFVSPAINLPSVTSGQHIVLTFAQWFSWAGYDPSYQAPSYGQVQVATWNSKTSSWNNWTPLAQYGGGTHNYAGSSSPGWSLSSVDLTAYASNQVEIGFQQIGGTNTAPGWYLDNINIAVQNIYLPLNQTQLFGSFTPTNWFGWSADDGSWQVGAPASGIGPGTPAPGDKQCAGTVLSGPQAGTYAANTVTDFITPPISLPSTASGQHIYMSFEQWFNWAGYDPSYQSPSYGQVWAATWNTKTKSWNSATTLQVYGGGSNNTAGTSSGGWAKSRIDISKYAGNVIAVGFEQIGGTNVAPGWYLDDVAIVLPAPTITTFSPTTGPVGMTVTINGKFLEGAQVSFNGTACPPSTVQVLSDTQLTAVVPTGATTGPITVTTLGGTVTTSTNFVVQTLTVSRLSFNPKTLFGGQMITGTVTIGQPAPSPTTVTLVANPSSALTVPSSVTVPTGSTTATFQATANNVSTATPVTVTATLGSTSASDAVTVLPWMQGVSLSPTSVIGGNGNSFGVVTLGAPVSSDTVVTLTSSATCAQVPSSVTVPAGQTSQYFNITTTAVTSSTKATITATSNGSSSTGTLTVNPMPTGTLTILPSSIKGGGNAFALLTLASAPTSATTVTFTSSNTKVAVPNPTSVQLSAGTTTTIISINTFPVTSATSVVITATVNGQKVTAVLKVTP